jgi:K+-sensing histidine kinase KdpD
MASNADYRDLGLAMSRILRNPLAGLRASMESLVGELGEDATDASPETTLKSALDQVTQLSRDVEALVDFAAPRPLAPLQCTLEEIVQAALCTLPGGLRARVRVARPEAPKSVLVDGPVLATCLGHLLESALEASSGDDWVLLQVRDEDGATLFAIVEGGDASLLHPGSGHQDSTRRAHLGLGVSVAVRDIDRMGAHLLLGTTERGCSRVVVRLPVNAEPGSQAEEAA